MIKTESYLIRKCFANLYKKKNDCSISSNHPKINYPSPREAVGLPESAVALLLNLDDTNLKT